MYGFTYCTCRFMGVMRHTGTYDTIITATSRPTTRYARYIQKQNLPEYSTEIVARCDDHKPAWQLSLSRVSNSSPDVRVTRSTVPYHMSVHGPGTCTGSPTMPRELMLCAFRFKAKCQSRPFLDLESHLHTTSRNQRSEPRGDR